MNKYTQDIVLGYGKMLFVAANQIDALNTKIDKIAAKKADIDDKILAMKDEVVRLYKELADLKIEKDNIVEDANELTENIIEKSGMNPEDLLEVVNVEFERKGNKVVKQVVQYKAGLDLNVIAPAEVNLYANTKEEKEA